jgi:hypothetical protein
MKSSIIEARRNLRDLLDAFEILDRTRTNMEVRGIWGDSYTQVARIQDYLNRKIAFCFRMYVQYDEPEFFDGLENVENDPMGVGLLRACKLEREARLHRSVGLPVDDEED